MIWIIASFILLCLSHFADWQLQCEQHAWKGLFLWNPFERAKHWAWYLDWFPHDMWHVSQWVRNWGALSACIITVMAWPLTYYIYAPIGFTALYIVTRGLCFSLPRKIARGWNA